MSQNTPREIGYSVGSLVEITINEADIDSEYNGQTCKILSNSPDDLHELTGDETDKHHYELQNVETGETLPLSFRHNDLTLLEPENK